MTNTKRFQKSVLWFLLITFGGFMTLGLCCQLACGQDVDAARERLRAIEAAREIPLQPVPDPISEAKPQPVICFERAVSSPPQGYFAFYFKSFCGPCERMKREGVPEAVKAAGWQIVTVNLDTDPQPTVKAAPETWYCDSDGRPIRKFRGYTTAKTLLTPVVADGLCRLASNGFHWSGVAISDNTILTCAHHEQTAGFFAEFPVAFGGDQYCRVNCELIKTDNAADLSVLRYSLPALVTVNSYTLSPLAESAIEVPGYLSGMQPKRVKLRPNQKNGFMMQGKRLDSYDGEGISSPQFGMSGSPLLTPDKSIAGIQSVGSGREVGAIRLDTIREFLQDVDFSAEPAIVAHVTDAEPSADTLAAVVAAHLAELAEAPAEAEPIAYGSFFSFDVDAPDSWKVIGAKILQAQTLQFPSAGLTVDWSGPSRSFVVQSSGITISPPVKVTFEKFRLRYTARLDGINYTPDLSTVTVLLTGAPDLTMNLK